MIKFIIISAALLLLGTACSTLTLQPANFSWPVESLLKVDDRGNVTEDRYSTSFNTIGLYYEEFQDSLAYKGKSLHLIRNNQGNYFITGNEFKNVYVFRTSGGALALEKKIFISEFGLKDPALNQRSPYIELLDGENKINLTSDGIEGGSK